MTAAHAASERDVDADGFESLFDLSDNLFYVT